MKWLSWPSWLTCSRWFTHISGHPSAAGRAQDRESSPVRDRRSTTVLRHQPHGMEDWTIAVFVYLGQQLSGVVAGEILQSDKTIAPAAGVFCVWTWQCRLRLRVMSWETCKHPARTLSSLPLARRCLYSTGARTGPPPIFWQTGVFMFALLSTFVNVKRANTQVENMHIVVD